MSSPLAPAGRHILILKVNKRKLDKLQDKLQVKSGQRLNLYFHFMYVNPTSFPGLFPFELIGSAGKDPGIGWSRAHLTPQNPGCN